jgi:hypothetical protein
MTAIITAKTAAPRRVSRSRRKSMAVGQVGLTHRGASWAGPRRKTSSIRTRVKIIIKRNSEVTEDLAEKIEAHGTRQRCVSVRS